MGAELKVHSLCTSFCLSTDSLLEAYTSTQSLLVELRFETVSRLLWLLPKPATRGSKNSTCSDPLKRRWYSVDFYCCKLSKKQVLNQLLLSSMCIQSMKLRAIFHQCRLTCLKVVCKSMSFVLFGMNIVTMSEYSTAKFL